MDAPTSAILQPGPGLTVHVAVRAAGRLAFGTVRGLRPGHLHLTCGESVVGPAVVKVLGRPGLESVALEGTLGPADGDLVLALADWPLPALPQVLALLGRTEAELPPPREARRLSGPMPPLPLRPTPAPTVVAEPPARGSEPGSGAGARNLSPRPEPGSLPRSEAASDDKGFAERNPVSPTPTRAHRSILPAPPAPRATADRLAAAAPRGLVEPERVRVAVLPVGSRALAAALVRQSGDPTPTFDLDGAPALAPRQVVVLQVPTPLGPVLLEATALAPRRAGARVRLGALPAPLRAWLEALA